MEKGENIKENQEEIKKKIISPDMNNGNNAKDLKNKEFINNIKWCENDNQNYTFLSNLEEIAYYPSAPASMCKKKTHSSKPIVKKFNIKQDRWDEYLEYFEP